MTDKTGKAAPPKDDGGDAARDARGRWRKGHCPNPKGRPRKKRFKDYDPSDIRLFANTRIEIAANGALEQMDRRTALLTKMFESAMKGRVSMQRFLYDAFEKNDAKIAGARRRLDHLVSEHIIDNERFSDGIPPRIQREILELAELLEHYFPGRYSHLLPIRDE